MNGDVPVKPLVNQRHHSGAPNLLLQHLKCPQILHRLPEHLEPEGIDRGSIRSGIDQE